MGEVVCDIAFLRPDPVIRTVYDIFSRDMSVMISVEVLG